MEKNKNKCLRKMFWLTSSLGRVAFIRNFLVNVEVKFQIDRILKLFLRHYLCGRKLYWKYRKCIRTLLWNAQITWNAGLDKIKGCCLYELNWRLSRASLIFGYCSCFRKIADVLQIIQTIHHQVTTKIQIWANRNSPVN